MTQQYILPKIASINDRVYFNIDSCGEYLRIMQCLAEESHKHFEGYYRCKNKRYKTGYCEEKCGIHQEMVLSLDKLSFIFLVFPSNEKMPP